MSVRPLKSCFAPYLAWQFQRYQVQEWLLQNAIGTTMASLNQGILSRVRVPYAPPPEQRAIAEALSDVDGLLGALEALIAKKWAIKQAAMQQLLTGKTRLPGFSGAWETKRLGEIGAFSKGRGVRRDDVVDDGLPCIRYGELYTRYHNYVTTPISRISPHVAPTAWPIKTGDLLFASSGETAGEIGTCAAYLGREQAFAGGDIVVLSPFGQNSMYLGHLMNHPLVATQKARFGQGDAVVHISAKNLAQIETALPRVDEQDAIAAVLSDMDAEIATLQRRRDKTRDIKQGMMQQLLTGRVRLVERGRTADA
jgi:type I restriction enzyme S subunit